MASLFSLSFFLKLVSGEVFIHCLEDDLHENFVSHLMSGLLQAGVEPSLVAVGVLSEKFMPSITRFQIGIVVFTKAYIESSRCVEDLLRIIECHETYGLMIIPVFYDTDQSFLVRVSEENFRNARRAQRRAEAQAKIRITADSGEIYDKRMRPKAKTMQNFSLSRALNRVRNLPTWDESKHRDDAELVEEIVKSVLAKLDRALPGTEAIVGLSLNTKLTNSDSFKADAFKEMKTLRFLQLDHVRLTGDYGYLSKQLRCISWQGFSLEHIPNNFYLEGAIVMDFQHSNLRLLWKEPTVDEGKGLSRTVLHSIILSWMSHTFNTLYRMRPFRGISPSLASMNVEHNDLVDLAPILRTILNLRTVLVQCVTEYLILQQVTAILEEVQQVRRVTWTTSTQLSNHPFSPYSIQFGGYQEEVFNALRKSIYDEELAARQTGKVFVPSDNYPHWLAYKNEGHSVNFTVPDNFHMDGMILCVEHLSRLGDPTQYLICVLMVNYTKCTIQLFNRETLTSLNDVDWHGVISHMGCGDKLEIFIIFEKGFEVQKTAVYLVCNDQLTEESNLTSCLSSIGGHVGQIDDKESVGGILHSSHDGGWRGGGIITHCKCGDIVRLILSLAFLGTPHSHFSALLCDCVLLGSENTPSSARLPLAPKSPKSKLVGIVFGLVEKLAALARERGGGSLECQIHDGDWRILKNKKIGF
ncbi:hypothetical protein LR48_Vigan521s000500 [Vigna angularis]|uniref:TIR domain-containing protein n=1 Tax=Phaseolus angularis TaxID=3914 RepID=A0A0L9TCR8_PHAAN|nr:hypothetical protein LR48_Vigan521s000500 [Vigna angularis]